MKTKHLFLLFLINISFIYSQNTTPKQKSNIFKTSGNVLKNSFKSMPGDFKYMGKSFSDNWKTTAIYTAGVAGLILTDKITTSFWHRNIEPNIQYTLPNITVFKRGISPWLQGNDAYMSYPIIGLFAGSFLTNYEKGQYVSINAFKAIAYSTLISHLALKTIFGRNRPQRPIYSDEPATASWTKNNFDFFNDREGVYINSGPKGSAFPSLHATAFFAIAKVFQMEYDNYWIPYSFMSLVFLSDIESHNHWVSDLVVGGIVGTIIGRSIVKSSWEIRNKTAKKNKKIISFQMVPQVSSQWTGLHIVGTF